MASPTNGSQFGDSKRTISGSSFKGEDIDPSIVQPFFFGGGNKSVCCKGAQHCASLLGRCDISGRSRSYLRMLRTKYEEGRQALVQPPKKLQEEIETLESMWQSHWEKVYGPGCRNEIFKQLQEDNKRMRLLAAMGDYLEPICTEMKRCKLPDRQINEFQNFLYWTDCLAFLKKEDQVFEAWASSGAKGEKPDSPLRETVVAVAKEMSVKVETVRFWISLYADRNTTFHCGLKDHIAEIRWDNLAAHIKTDIENIALITPSSKKADAYLINKTIDCFQDLYFKSVEWDRVGKLQRTVLTQRALDITQDFDSDHRVRKAKQKERRKEQRSAADCRCGEGRTD